MSSCTFVALVAAVGIVPIVLMILYLWAKIDTSDDQ